MLKAITCSLLMEQVLAPSFSFKTKVTNDDVAGPGRGVGGHGLLLGLMRRAFAVLGVLVGLGVLIIAPLYAWEHAGGRTFELNAATLATFAYVGTLPSVAAYFFFNLGVGAIGPARAAMFIHLMPAFGALLSVAFLGEAFYLYHALGIAGILAGVGLSTRGR